MSANDWGGDGMAGLTDILVSAMHPGQRMLLSTSDGFALAFAGCGAYEAEVWAVRQALALPDRSAHEAAAAPRDPATAPLCMGGASFVLSSSQP
ncbi:hypothetical protein [Diaphorobacter aerolatus]|uniref:Uncharacterized protein n=1 Tax=Diaphorobacter aerolatus TaxID=1288495 RepID=A0A7H0GM01_9BURK|nr:hypothetical protein [Diaphorobacter aerolatus]QNP49317.1 hypothetical protein H9K75_04435 [Diaphorobacter aerolatus]